MKKKHQLIHNNEVYLFDIFRIIWKDKILALLICLTLSITSYFFFTLQPKTYKTGVKIREVSVINFDEYYLFAKETNRQLESFVTYFNNTFMEQLSSENSLDEFKKNSELSKLKSNLKDNNIDSRKFSKKSFKIDYVDVQGKKNINNIYFTYEKDLPGEEILDSYIIFVKNKADEILKRNILVAVKNDIEYFKFNLLIADKLNLKKLQDSSSPQAYSNNPFLYGQDILKIKIIFLEDFIKRNETIKLNYNPILEKIMPTTDFRSVKIDMVFSFILGLFFSLIIIYLKFWVKKIYF